MNVQDFRTLLEQTDDKLSELSNLETLNKYNISVYEFLNLIRDFLNDEEKLKLLNFKGLNTSITSGIMKLVSDENILLQIVSNDTIMNEFVRIYK